MALGELVTSHTGATPSKARADFWRGTMPWVSPKDFSGFHLAEAQDHISEAAVTACGLHRVPRDSVLVVVRSGILRHSLPVALTVREVCTNQDIVALVPRGDLDAAFLAAYLTTAADEVRPLIVKHSTTVHSVNSEQLRALPVPLPPAHLQRSLVAGLIGSLDAASRMLARADRLAAELDGWVLSELGLQVAECPVDVPFAVAAGDVRGGRLDVGYNSPGHARVARALAECPYPTVPIGEIAPDLAGGATPKRGDPDLYADEGIRFLRVLNVASNEVLMDEIKYIAAHVHEDQLARSQLRAGDVLMTITGRVGTAAVVTEEILPANINQHIVRLRLASGDCRPEYLAAYLNTSVGTAVSNREATGGTRMALDYGAIRRLPVPLPPLRVQRRIEEQLHDRRVQASRLRTEARERLAAARIEFQDALREGGRR